MSPAVRVPVVLLAAVAACLAIIQGALAAPGAAAPNSAACLRGHWVAPFAESERVLKLLVPGPYRFTSKLYMDFRGGTMQYGTTSFTISAGNTNAKGSFFVLHPYTARRGSVTLGRGETTLSLVALGQRITRPVAGGTVPFECSATRLRYRVPVAGWLTLSRAR